MHVCAVSCFEMHVETEDITAAAAAAFLSIFITLSHILHQAITHEYRLLCMNFAAYKSFFTHSFIQSVIFIIITCTL